MEHLYTRSPIGHWLLGTRVETTTGASMVRLLHRAPQGVGKSNEGEEKGAQSSCHIVAQSVI